jgi:hypothetical protein
MRGLQLLYADPRPAKIWMKVSGPSVVSTLYDPAEE